MTYRKLDKKDALDAKHFAVLLAKIMCDCVARITIFSAWMFVTNDGKFDTMNVLMIYYSLALFMMVFNVVFNRKCEMTDGKYWIGKNSKVDYIILN